MAKLLSFACTFINRLSSYLRSGLNMILFSAILFLVCSCAMLFGNTDREVRIDTTPAGANVYINGALYAKTPARILLVDAGYHKHEIMIGKPGYESEVIVKYRVSKGWVLEFTLPYWISY